MKKYLFLLLLSVLMLPAKAQMDSMSVDSDSVATLPWPQTLQADIDTLILSSSLLNISEVGIMVYDLTTDSTLYTYNHRHTLRPASNMKLVTAIAALDRLGGGHQFQTSLYYTGDLDSCTLRGDLYCVGGMDPRFNADDLNAFVEQVKGLGIDTIRGRIVADKSMKDEDLLGSGWCWDDDNPTLSPLLISRKDNFTERYANALQKAGVFVDVSLTEGKLPNGAKKLCTRFHTMDQILMKMMKDSDNLYAESMFYQLGASSGKPATMKKARAIINKLIDRLGLPSSAYNIADGSGLSLYNYLSPELEVALLKYAWKNSEIRIHLYPSLPIAGQDGTLSKRMQRTAAAGNVHAKTGTLKGVTTLAGYCTAKNGHVLCFAIMNQGVLQTTRGRDFQDKICALMCQ